MTSKTINRSAQVFNDYLAKQDNRFKPHLRALRELILNLVPDATELFSYQVHCFKQTYMLVGIGTTKDFCSLYTMSSSLVKKMKEELTDCKISGTTIHFKPGADLPVAAITKIVQARMRENELIAQNRKKLK